MDTIEKSKGNKIWSSKKARSFNQNWSSETEVHELLFALVRSLKPDNVLEIGTFEGDTALAIARALKENKLGHLTTTDIRSFGQEMFLVDNDVGEYVTCVTSNPVEYLEQQQSGSFDFIFIDGSHEYKEVSRDLEMSDRLIKDQGYIVGHDAIMIPDVVTAYTSFMEKNKDKYKDIVLDTYAGVFILKKMHG